MSEINGMISEKHQFAALLEKQNASDILSRAYQPLAWVHPEWIKKVLPSAYPIDEQCVKMNTFVSDALSIPRDFDLATDSVLSKFMLLENQTIKKVIGLLGLCRYQKAVKVLISKQIKSEIDNQVGCNATDIVLKKLPFMLSEFPTELANDTHTFTSIKALPCFISEGMMIFEHIAKSGSQYEFLRFALSPEFSVENGMAALSQTTRDKTTLLVKKLAIEIDRTCSNLLK